MRAARSRARRSPASSGAPRQHAEDDCFVPELRRRREDRPRARARAVRARPYEVHAGAREFVSIVGPSGCGRSTLLMFIAGLVPATVGAVVIQGQRVSRPYTDVGMVGMRCWPLRRRLVFGDVVSRGLEVMSGYLPKGIDVRYPSTLRRSLIGT